MTQPDKEPAPLNIMSIIASIVFGGAAIVALAFPCYILFMVLFGGALSCEPAVTCQ